MSATLEYTAPLVEAIAESAKARKGGRVSTKAKTSLKEQDQAAKEARRNAHDSWLARAAAFATEGKVARTALDSYQWRLGDFLLEYPNGIAIDADGVSGIPYEKVSEVTGVPLPQLRDFAWVSNRAPLSVRVQILSWSHHKMVAKLDPEAQRKELAFAVEKKLSANQLRKKLQSDKPAARDEELERLRRLAYELVGCGLTIERSKYKSTLFYNHPYPFVVGFSCDSDRQAEQTIKELKLYLEWRNRNVTAEGYPKDKLDPSNLVDSEALARAECAIA